MAIDDIDLRILDMLQRNGKLSQAKIAGAVGLTTPSVNDNRSGNTSFRKTRPRC